MMSSITHLGFIQNLGGWQVLLIVLVIILLFGGKRLPELGRGIGKFLREFKKGVRETEQDIREALDTDLDDDKDTPKSPLASHEEKKHQSPLSSHAESSAKNDEPRKPDSSGS